MEFKAKLVQYLSSTRTTREIGLDHALILNQDIYSPELPLHVVSTAWLLDKNRSRVCKMKDASSQTWVLPHRHLLKGELPHCAAYRAAYEAFGIIHLILEHNDIAYVTIEESHDNAFEHCHINVHYQFSMGIFDMQGSIKKQGVHYEWFALEETSDTAWLISPPPIETAVYANKSL
ncbi:hypothetical protein ACI2KR_09310 [Pseudomonas luteola]